MASPSRLPEDTRQAMHLDKLEQASWLEDENTDDGDCWGQDPAIAAERREDVLGVNYFNQPIN